MGAIEVHSPARFLKELDDHSSPLIHQNGFANYSAETAFSEKVRMTTDRAILVYWPARGLINATRLLLEHVGEPYEMVTFPWTPIPGSDQDWSSVRSKLGLDFPSLPLVKDGESIITQSEAVIRYFARKHNLVALSEQEHQDHDIVNGVVSDMRLAFGGLLFRAVDFELEKVTYRLNVYCPRLKELNKFLIKRDFLLGNRLTYVDFKLFELLDVHCLLYPGILQDYDNLQNYHANILALKGVKEFMKSGRMPTVINGLAAKWGGPLN